MTDPSQTRRALEIFKQVLSCGVAERRALLESACGGDGELRAVVEEMLRADAEGGGATQDATRFVDEQRLVVSELGADAPPERIGPYTILNRIGEGGFGTVFVAEQEEPVRRRVALKIIKLGMDSPQVVARFEQERQALALMEHPNIARVLDAGTTESGRPYFVMDLVEGVPITEYCDENRLRIEQRLELLVQVCMAVQHAHTKGIVHRDLKPSNILVSSVDDRPAVKVIDFGIAKAIERKLTEKTFFTEQRQLVGTPEYMSPEQAEGSVDIDTRTDVYSLGVLLYELITGSPPFRFTELRNAAYGEIQRIIREVEPPRPSAHLRQSTDTLASVAAHRHVEPRRLGTLVRGELDWIVMKPLEKDRDRRYQTARDLARDIERYLAGEAVEARPPSAAYRMQKFLRRNRGAVIAASSLLVVLVAGVVGTTLGLLEARDNARVATARLARLEQGVDILGSIFADLDPMAEEKGEPLAAALARQLDRAVEDLRGDALGDPLITAGLQEKLAASLVGLGRFDQAVEVLRSVVEVRRAELGNEDRDTLRSVVALGTARAAAGDAAGARTLFEEVLPILERVAAKDDPLVLRCRAEYAGALVQLRLFQEAYAELASVLQVYRDAGRLDEPTALRTTGKLAYAYLENENFQEAVPLLEELVPRYEAVLGVDHPDTLGARNDLAMAYQQAGDYVQCIPLLQRVHEALIVRLGVDHPRTLDAHFNLASAQRMAGEIHHAVPIFERLVAIYEARLGPSHDKTLTTMSQLGVSYTSLGEHGKARDLYEAAVAAAPPLDGTEELWGPQLRLNLAHALNKTGDAERALEIYEAVLTTFEGTEVGRSPALLKCRFQWAETLSEQDRHRRGIEIARPALEEAESLLGEDHPVTMYGRNALSYAYRYAGELENALPLLERNLESIARELGDEHPQTIITRINFASAVRDAGDLPRALALMEEGIEQSDGTNGPLHPTTLAIREIRCDTLEKAEDWERAIPERRTLLEIERAREEVDQRLALSLYFLGRALLKAGRAEEAEPSLRESAAVFGEIDPEGWMRFNSQAVLGGALLAQERFDEAEASLLAAYRGMNERAAAIPRPSWKRVLWAIERLIELNDATGRSDEAARWRAELERQRHAKDDGA